MIIKDGKLVYPEKKIRMNNHELVVNGTEGLQWCDFDALSLTNSPIDMIAFRKFRAAISREAGTDSFDIPEKFHTLIALLVQDRYENIAFLLLCLIQFTEIAKAMRPSQLCRPD